MILQVRYAAKGDRVPHDLESVSSPWLLSRTSFYGAVEEEELVARRGSKDGSLV